ncbi:MAG: HEPN domain-containing protein [Deltaproteobacteria bacterium]|nr:HEPN domain-containing protein [Deltaproteobacteria bacterium]
MGIGCRFASEYAPKIHNLVNLLQKTGLSLPDEMKDFVQRIDNVSIATRYPEYLRVLSNEFNEETVKMILADTKRTIKWLKQRLQ